MAELYFFLEDSDVFFYDTIHINQKNSSMSFIKHVAVDNNSTHN